MACIVDNLVRKMVVSLDEHSTVQQAAELMAQQDVRFLLVTGNGRVVGLLTEQDLLRRVLGTAQNPHAVSLGEVCSRNVVSIAHDSSCKEAMRKLRTHLCQHLVVYRGNSLRGLVSRTDLTNAVADPGGRKDWVVNLFGIVTLTAAISVIAMLVYQLPEMMQLAERVTAH